MQDTIESITFLLGLVRPPGPKLSDLVHRKFICASQNYC